MTDENRATVDPFSLTRLVEAGVNHANEILIRRRQTELAPLVHLVDANGKSLILSCIWKTDLQKKIVMHGAKMKAREIGARVAMFVSEFWTYPPEVMQHLTTREAVERHYRKILPSQHPNRQEGVFVAATDGKKIEARMFKTVRDRPGGRVVSFDEIIGLTHAGIDLGILEGLVVPSEQTPHK